MDLRQLRYLVALADERNFTRAAEREHIAQPALSQQLRRLEQELGLGLVERTTRRVVITEAGELLVRRARLILAELDAAHDEMQSLRGAWTGRVRIGTMHTMGPIDVSLPLAIFHERHPGVELAVREQSSEESAELVRLGDLDVAFLSVTEQVESHGLALRQLIVEELVVIMPQSHRFGARSEIRMEELAGEQFVSYRSGARLRELLESAASDAGFTPRIIVETNESRRIRRLVARGLGVAILPRSDCVGPGADVGLAVLVGRDLTRDITLAWREGRRLSPAAAEFLSLALDTFSPEEGIAWNPAFASLPGDPGL